MGQIRIERDVTAFGGAHAIRISNDAVEVVVATDYGPRVMGYVAHGRRNVLGFIDPKRQSKPTPFGEPWHIYGGHRLWHGPEDPVRTYVPDNAPVEVAIDGAGTIVLTQTVERLTSLVKQIRISLSDVGSRTTLEHRITNAGRDPVELAVWALSLMAAGGEAIFPNPPFAPHPEGLLPVRRIVLWPYSWLGDSRFRLGRRFTRLRQDESAEGPQKLGLFDESEGWAAYAVSGDLFVKRYDAPKAEGAYVDLGCNVEAFTSSTFLELETLGPSVRLLPGATATHSERWYLFPSVAIPEDDDDASRVLASFVTRTT